MPLRLVSVKIRGFRGYTIEQTIDFENPVVILTGENAVGKSSTLNAVEWCLFGDECTGKGTLIRERVDWELANRNMPTSDVSVELTLASVEGPYCIRRCLKPRPRRGGLQEELEVQAPDGKKHLGEEAKLKLSALIRSSFRDFSTTIYQHQEVIRSIVTQEPKDRNQAFDRLLGLSEFRELIAGIDSTGVSAWHRQMVSDFGSLQGEVSQALKLRQRDLDTKQRELSASGIGGADLTPVGALRIAARAKESLTEFANAAGIDSKQIENLTDWHTFALFETNVRREIGRLRAEVPEAKEQTELSSTRGSLGSASGRWEAANRNNEEAARSIQDFTRKFGDEAAITAKVKEQRNAISAAEDEKRLVNERAQLVAEGIRFLQKAGKPEQHMRCPLCGNSAPDLLEHLRNEWESEIRVQVEALDGRIRAAHEQEEKAIKDGEALKRLESQLLMAKHELDKARTEVGTRIGSNLSETDDPAAILRIKMGEIEARLAQLNNAMVKKQEQLSAVDAELTRARGVVDYLSLQDRTNSIEQVQGSSQYKNLEALRDRAARWVNDIDDVKEAIKAATNDEAKTRVKGAGDAINDFFLKLAEHPVSNRVILEVTPDARTGLNSYEIRGPDGKDLVPVLGQGDLNALALAIFLGLACASADDRGFGFVMLDDPSQSLGSGHKRRLANVLNEVSNKKELTVVSTMDSELSDLLRSRITKAKTTYHFRGWDVSNGPKIDKV